jgi:hypothetical protein
MNYNKLFFVLLFLVSCLSVPAQKFIEKPYNTWGKEDTLRLISDSAWAKPYQSTQATANASAAQVAGAQGQSSTGGGSNPRSVARDFGPPPVTLRLHSGLPIRQAVVRLQQLDVGYDKMSEADKAAFDKTRKGYLDCAICKEYYVVTLVRAVDSTGTLSEEGVFQGFTMEDMKGNLRLENDLGESRDIAEFNPPKNSRDAAVFYFKRNDAAGKPLFSPESKEIRLIFKSDFLSTRNRFAYLVPRSFVFKASKLVVGDSLLF